MLNAISEKERLAKENKDGKKWTSTKYISLMSLGVSKEKRPKPTTVEYNKLH